MGKTTTLPVSSYDHLRNAAQSRSYIDGLTHAFYAYPARFPPEFAAAAIECFSAPGDVVLDPYMGGGTTPVEALTRGRRVVGSDINSLSIFLARAKTTPLGAEEFEAVRNWAIELQATLTYRHPRSEVAAYLDDRRTRNLSAAPLRSLKKAVAIALSAADTLPTDNAQNFARCVLLRTARRALDGRRDPPSIAVFREQLAQYSDKMAQSLSTFASLLPSPHPTANFLCASADQLDTAIPRVLRDGVVDLVVTSPPYPGVHVLYHRWQVLGGRETPAPYWIANCQDGCGESYYNFGDRREARLETYFESSLATLRAIRRVMRPGAYFVQMVGFANPRRDVRRYLKNMEESGFVEVEPPVGRTRIWRSAPRRKWHATLRGPTPGAREVILVHQAVG
jgi:DNA modification methylase